MVVKKGSLILPKVELVRMFSLNYKLRVVQTKFLSHLVDVCFKKLYGNQTTLI